MGGPVQEVCGHLCVIEYLGPFAEREVGGDDQRGPFVQLRDQVKEQLAAAFAERQIPEFIEDHEVLPGQVFGQLAAPVGKFLLLQLVDQVHQVKEFPLSAVSDGLPAQGDGKVCFAAARAADKDDIAMIGLLRGGALLDAG